MPEIPDIEVYVEALSSRVSNEPLLGVRVASPFVLRTFAPPLSAAKGKRVIGVRRLAKRVVFCLEDELFLVVHLMVSGRFKWAAPGAKVPGKVGLLAFDFGPGTLILTEASPKKRASLHVVQGEAALDELHAHGLEVAHASLAEFRAVLARENRTLKRFLTDPRLLAGIGNSYSDEILHHAGLSPVKLTQSLDDESVKKLYDSIRTVLALWTERLRAEAKGKFPEKVTAFRPEMAVHGKFGEPCPVCGTKVQHIVYAENECNYCPRCQTGGKLLADRSLSRLLHADWPKTIEDLEERAKNA